MSDRCHGCFGSSFGDCDECQREKSTVPATLIIPGKLPNLNDYTEACRGNRYSGAKMKKNAEEIICSHILEQIPRAHFDCPVQVSFRWYEANRRRDLDNIAFAKKFILDALVRSGVLDNDNWQGVSGFSDSFFIDPKNPRIEVDISPVEISLNCRF